MWSPRPLPAAAIGALVAAGIPVCRIAPPTEGIVILGAPLGSDAYMSAHCVAAVTSQFAVLDSPSFGALSVQARWLQFHYAVSKRVNHLARLVPPGCLSAAQALARSKLASAFASLFNMPSPLREDIAMRLFLPVRVGGLGVCPFTPESAFLAGVLAGRKAVLARLGPAGEPAPGGRALSPSDTSLKEAALGVTAVDFYFGRLHDARNFLAAAEVHSAALAKAANRAPPSPLQIAEAAKAAIGKGPTALADILDPSLEGLLPRNLQALLSAILHAVHLEEWRSRVAPDLDACRIGCTGPGAATWLVSVPGSTRSAFSHACSCGRMI